MRCRGPCGEGGLCTNRTRLIAGAFVAAAVAVPLYAAAASTDRAAGHGQPACLAWFGNKEDGKCLSYSNGQPVYVGTPQFTTAATAPTRGLEHRAAAARHHYQPGHRLAASVPSSPPSPVRGPRCRSRWAST